MKNCYEMLYDSKTRIHFKRRVICKISIKKLKIGLQFCFIWVLKKNLPGGACPRTPHRQSGQVLSNDQLCGVITNGRHLT